MFGLLKAAVLLAPAFELALAAIPEVISTSDGVDRLIEDITSNALITLELGGDSNDDVLRQTNLDLRVFESTASCGYGNVTLNGAPLAQDDLGIGSGSIPTDIGSVLEADWKFTCVHLERDSQVQLLSVQIVSVDNRPVGDVAFSVQFQQVAPVSIFYVDSAAAKLKSSLTPDLSDNPQPSLEDELAELEMLKEQLLTLEHTIALKITHISDTFNLDRPEDLLQATNCDGLKCFFSTVYSRVKTMASKLYHGSQERLGSLGGQRPLTEVNDVEKSDSTTTSQEPAQVSNQDKTEGLISIAGNGAGRVNQLSPPVTDKPYRVLHIVGLVALVLAIVINVAVMVLIFQFVRFRRQRRKALWEKRRGQLRKSRDDCNALVATKYMDLIKWLRDGLAREDLEGQEKDAIMRQMHESSSSEGSSDTMSITMEEEIAQFRAAANVVGNLVTTEEGRGRSRLSQHLAMARSRRASTPSSIMSSCPTYRSVDESLPAYDENRSPEYVVDGFQYTPDSSTLGNLSPRSSSPRSSMSADSTACSSLDENADGKD
ncbi:hypothetical protein O1611_g4850 [Lasiodiplodia mahajangana]|uniref:Uncharacterized protein n=1 Tax=Lasiodiplodia mahajangana TaxID=1108764 RepID=A0ACC2JMU8_9PEZI|nr:hypothetical protein O1611_g4850 [Lasiodiplodia mahajangana]